MNTGSVTQTDINAVLTQMRALRARAQTGVGEGPGTLERAGIATDRAQPAAAARSSQVDFGGILKNAVGQVNQLQQNASASANAFIAGKENDLVKVMVEGQKASVGFQAMVQVRNRMISAYQDIMNMPI